MILVFVGMVITSLGVVRERQAGTLEQLAVMPLRPAGRVPRQDRAVFPGGRGGPGDRRRVGVALFAVPFRGSPAVFALGALLFLFVTLGIGVLISSVSQNQGQAIQLAIMVLLPQILLSGLIFPLSSIVAGVRWIGYLLPLTYFNEIARGVMLRAEPLGGAVAAVRLPGAARRGGDGARDLRFRRVPGTRAAAPAADGKPDGRASRNWPRPAAAKL